MTASTSRARRFVLAMVATIAVSAPAAAEEMLYFVDGDRLVFTNTQERRDARPVPGVETLPAGGAMPAQGKRPLPRTIYDSYIDKVATEYGLKPELIKAVALVESNLDPHAVSPKGAQGLMQLMPATAEQYGVDDAFDPLQNLRAGAAHLRTLLDEFEGDLTLALAAYNAGSGAVRRYDGVPAYPETQRYVQLVRDRLEGRVTRRGAKAAPPAKPVRARRMADGTIMLSN